MPQFIKHKDDAGTSIVTGENDAQYRTWGENAKTRGNVNKAKDAHAHAFMRNALAQRDHGRKRSQGAHATRRGSAAEDEVFGQDPELL